MAMASGLVMISMVMTPPTGAPFPGPQAAEAGEVTIERWPASVDHSAVQTVAEARRLVRDQLRKAARKAAKRTSRLVVLGVEPIAVAQGAYQDSTRLARTQLYSGLSQFQNQIERDTPLGDVAEVRAANRGIRKKIRSLASITGPPRKKKGRKGKA